jgi:hypothetical protein
MSCLFEFLARTSWCCPRRPPSRIYLKGVENRIRIGRRFLFTRCTPKLKPYCLPYKRQIGRLGVDWLVPVLHKGEEWSDSRKLLDRSLRHTAAPTSYRKMMEEKTRAFLGQLLATPNEFRSHLEL